MDYTVLSPPLLSHDLYSPLRWEIYPRFQRVSFLDLKPVIQSY